MAAWANPTLSAASRAMLGSMKGRKAKLERSSTRFLCTHTGSLPRPEQLIRDMYAKEEGVPVDRTALGAHIRAAVAEVVKKQAEAGVDFINDGVMSKPRYATYINAPLGGR